MQCEQNGSRVLLLYRRFPGRRNLDGNPEPWGTKRMVQSGFEPETSREQHM